MQTLSLLCTKQISSLDVYSDHGDLLRLPKIISHHIARGSAHCCQWRRRDRKKNGSKATSDCCKVTTEGKPFPTTHLAPSACPDPFQTGKDCTGALAAWAKTVAIALLPKRQTLTQQREVQPTGKNVQSFLPKVCPIL